MRIITTFILLFSFLFLSPSNVFAKSNPDYGEIQDGVTYTLDPNDLEALQYKRPNAIMVHFMSPFPMIGAAITYDIQYLKYFAFGFGFGNMFLTPTLPFINSYSGPGTPVNNFLFPVYFNWYFFSSDRFMGRFYFTLQGMPMWLRSHKVDYLPVAVTAGMGYEYRHHSGFIFRAASSIGAVVNKSLSFYRKSIDPAFIPIMFDLGIGYAF